MCILFSPGQFASKSTILFTIRQLFATLFFRPGYSESVCQDDSEVPLSGKSPIPGGGQYVFSRDSLPVLHRASASRSRSSGSSSGFIEPVTERQGEIAAQKLAPTVLDISRVDRRGEVAVAVQNVVDRKAGLSAVFHEAV